MKYILILLASTVLLLTSCELNVYSPENQIKRLPTDAKVIKRYDDKWMIWKLGESCYLSRNIGRQGGALTVTKCPEGK